MEERRKRGEREEKERRKRGKREEKERRKREIVERMNHCGLALLL